MYLRNKISNQRLALGKQSIRSKNDLEAISQKKPMIEWSSLASSVSRIFLQSFPLIFLLTVSQTKELKLRKLISLNVYFSLLEVEPDDAQGLTSLCTCPRVHPWGSTVGSWSLLVRQDICSSMDGPRDYHTE